MLPSLSGYNKWLEGVYRTKDLFKIQIQEHEKTLNADNPRDFIDMYLIEMKMNPDPEFNIDQLVMLGHDLISAGSETVATTLNWIILYLTINPDVQEKCYQEIAQHVSDGALKETETLNYCQATIAEVQRMSQVAVASVQHRVIKEVKGYIVLFIDIKINYIGDTPIWTCHP